MAFLRVSRDRRGTSTRSPQNEPAGQARSAIVYWFRTPLHVRVGQPLDDETIGRLCGLHPHRVFDWPKLRQSLAAARQAESDTRRG
jgi:hypothetical protein